MTANDEVDAGRHTFLKLPQHGRDWITTGFGSFAGRENPPLSLHNKTRGLRTLTLGLFQSPNYAGKQQ
jgi:hypothetical protein